MVVLQVLLTLAFLVFIRYFWIFLKFRKTYNLLPGEENIHPVYGNLNTFPGFNKKGLLYEHELSKKYKYFHRMWIGPFLPCLVVYHPDIIREILKHSIKPKSSGIVSASYDLLTAWLGGGLVFINGDLWLRNRRLLNHCFHLNNLKQHISVYNSCIDVLLFKIREFTQKDKSFDIQPLIHHYTLDVILQSSFSMKSECQTKVEKSVYLKTVKELQELFLSRLGKPLLHIDFVYRWTAEGKRFQKLSKISHKETDLIISKRLRELDSSSTISSQNKSRDLLDTLLLIRDENGRGLTRKEIRDEVSTFLFAGHDTSFSTVNWTLRSIAEHQDVQEKVFQEVKSVLAGRDLVVWDDLSKLQYTTQVIKEAMRLHTVVPLIERSTTEDLTLNSYVVPKGTYVSLRLEVLHHNPHLWDDPLKFNPDRFHPDNACKMDPFQFIPFSAGSRNCIGQNFAMNEIKATVASLVQKFRLRVDPEKPLEYHMGIVMQAATGNFVYAEQRD